MSPLDKQVVGVNLVRGLDTRNDPRVILPGKLVKLENASLTKTGTLRRRDGSTTVASVSALQGLQTYDDELLALGGNTAYSYSPADGALLSRGGQTFTTIAKRSVIHNTSKQYYPDAATNGSYTCYVWTEYSAGAVFSATKYLLFDETTGTIVAGPTSIDTNNNGPPRVVSITGAFLIFYGGGANNLTCRVIQTASPTAIGSATNLVTDYNHGALDAIGEGSVGYVYFVSSAATANATQAIAVTQSGGTPSVSAGPVVVTTNAQTARGGITGVSIASFGGGKLAVCALVNAGSVGAGMWSGVLTTAMAVSAAAALKDATAAPTVGGWGGITAVLNGSTMWIYSDDAGRSGAAAAVSPIRRTGIDSANSTTSAAATWANSAVRVDGTNGPFIEAKGFLVGSTVYLPIYVREEGTGTLQNSWFLYNDSALPVASALNSTWGPRTSANASVTLPSVLGLSSTRFGVPTGEVGFTLSIDNGTTTSPTGISRLDVTFPSTAPISIQLGGQVITASGMATAYDGASPCEANFLLFPEVVTVADAGAGSVPNGVYLYSALYEWYDRSGQRHQSAPWPGVSYTVSGGPKNQTVTVPTLFVTQRTGINIVILRSANGSSTLQRVNPISDPVANSSSAATVTYTDSKTDAQLGEDVYTTGGVKPNDAIPPCSVLMKHQGRIWIDQGDNSGSFRFSQPHVTGYGLQWNEDLTGDIDAPITAFASMDEKAIIFAEEKIYVVFGNGPGTNGLGGSYSAPQQLAADVGCSEPRSILLMPDGLIFKSLKGWHRLGRDLNVTYIGEGAEAYNSQSVTSAVLFADRKECRFTTGTAEGVTLVYSYLYTDDRGIGQWGTSASQVSASALWWKTQDAYYRCTSAGLLIKELPPTAAGLAYGDLATTALGAIGGTAPIAQTGSVIPMTFRTGWLKPGEALQAFQRIWRVLLTGAATGYPPPYAVLTAAAGPSSNPDSIFVADTTVFTADQLLGNGLNFDLGNSSYEDNPNPYTIISATRIDLSVPLAVDHAIGAGVRGTIPTTVSAAGTLVVKFYFDGNDSAAFQTITISDVSTLVNGNAWNVRLQPNLQKCDAIMMEVVSTPAVQDPGASLNFSGMTMELGVKKGAKKFNAAQTK